MERLRALPARVQRRICRRPLLPPADTGLAAAEPDRRRRRAAGACLQHRLELRHEHELAELRRRVDHEPPHPDGRARGAELRLCRGRDRRRRRAHPRSHPPALGDDRQLLGRPHAGHRARSPTDRHGDRARPRESGRRPEPGGPAERTTLEGAAQSIYRAPIASQEAIKEFGTNGGGIANANSAHPFENPTALTNLIEMWALLAIPFALAFAFGRLVGDRRQGWALFAAMFVLWIASAGLATGFELDGNPRIDAGRSQHRRQGGALRRRRLRPVRGFDDGDVDRGGDRGARQLHAARRRGARS